MKTLAIAACCLLTTAPGFAQQPRAVNTRIIPRTTEAGLAAAVAGIASSQTEPAWIGYVVPAFNDGVQEQDDGWSARCRLEDNAGADGAGQIAPAAPIRLEPSPTVMMLLRVQGGAVERVRAISSDCAIDAGGLAMFWLERVDGKQSVEFLQAFATRSVRNQSDRALAAIALHADRAAADSLLNLAKGSPDANVRQRALFWVASRAGSQALPAISQAIERDPDANVKKQAVFALSRLPANEGVPLLISLARTSANPLVRKQAMFWLGQSKDPRALGFFEEILR